MSETTNKNLGHVTAYAYAKSKGYTGTEEEFAELMASYASTAETAIAAMEAAEAWATGGSGGTPSETNNAEHYAGVAEEAARNVAIQQYTVGAGRQYTKLSKCLEAIADNTWKKEIHIYGGTYDIFEEIGGSEYVDNIPSGSTWRTANNVIPPNTTIIGHGNVIIKMELPSTTASSKANLFSPINMQGSCTLKNLTIKAKNCRYCIHAEGTALTTFNNSTWRFEDCYIEKQDNEIAYVYTHAIGIGINNGNFLSIENCVISAQGTGSALAMHDNGELFSQSPVVVFSDSHFKAASKAVSLRSTPRENMATVIKTLFANCFLNGAVEKTTATSQQTADDVYAVTYLKTKHTNSISQYIENVIPDVVLEDPAVSISDFETVQTNVGTLQTDVGTLQTSVGTLQTDVGTLQTSVGTLQTDVGTLQTNVAGKVDKVPGKGLSENDFTSADKTALDNIKTTDKTLLQSGKAADAKIVGNATGYFVQALTTGGYITTNGASVDITSATAAAGYEYAVVACNPGDRFTVTGTGGGSPRLWCFIKSDGTPISRADASDAASKLALEAPANAAYLVFNSATSNANAEVAKGWTTQQVAADTSELLATAGITDIAFTTGKCIVTKSVGQTMTLSMTNTTNTACAYKQCYRGQRFRLSGTSSTNSGRAPWCFTDSNLVVLERHADSTATTYTNYEIVAPADGYLVTNMMFGTGYTYSAKTGFKDMAKTVAKNESDISDLTQYTQKPLTLLPSYFLGSMAYKPLGAPDKGFFCLVTDDGREDGTLGVTSYTIPMAIDKGIPVTFALMESSEVFTSDAWTATLVDAIENHGCSAAVHGVPRFTTYTEKGLADYIAGAVTFLTGKGITTIEGAVCPTHVINKRVMAVAGGMLGVVRSGYLGGTAEDKASYNGIDLTNFCDYYTSGAGSNLYGLSSFNIASKSLDYSKAAIDYAKTNNKILIALYHEHSTDIPDAETKTKIEAVIDYAIAEGLTFITLGDIARLPIANPSTY